eukprot:6210290-Pleurochrysis_carterae.AAC.1
MRARACLCARVRQSIIEIHGGERGLSEANCGESRSYADKRHAQRRSASVCMLGCLARFAATSICCTPRSLYAMCMNDTPLCEWSPAIAHSPLALSQTRPHASALSRARLARACSSATIG